MAVRLPYFVEDTTGPTSGSDYVSPELPTIVRSTPYGDVLIASVLDLYLFAGLSVQTVTLSVEGADEARTTWQTLFSQSGIQHAAGAAGFRTTLRIPTAWVRVRASISGAEAFSAYLLAARPALL